MARQRNQARRHLDPFAPGDRVEISFPLRRGSTNRLATVTEVNPAGLPPGVRLDLATPINGVSTAYATHTEVHLVNTATSH